MGLPLTFVRHVLLQAIVVRNRDIAEQDSRPFFNSWLVKTDRRPIEAEE